MKINLLDCTLREAPIDGLVLGRKFIKKFITALENSGVNIIECGFLKNGDFNPDSTVFTTVEEIEPYLSNKKPDKLYVALVDYGRYDLKKLSDYNGKSIDGIRICFKKQERFKVFDYAKAIKNKGYKVFLQNVDTLGYSDYELLEVIEKVNQLKPYAYSIVDTFGAMYADDVRSFFSLVSHNLDEDIMLGFHAHNNLMLANSNCQEFIGLAHKRKEISVDSSVLGCGRGAGNAHTELLAEFLNESYGTDYDLNSLLDVIDYLMPKFTEECEWGYSVPYFLSGIHNSHVFNVNHLLNRHNIKSKDLRAIIGKLDDTQKKTYDYKLLERLYVEHFGKRVDDTKFVENLRNEFLDRKIMCLIPGRNLRTESNKVQEFHNKEKPIVVAVNVYVEWYDIDYMFISNIKRYQEIIESKIDLSSKKIILTSNIKETASAENEYIVDYMSLIKFGWINVDTAAIMFLRLLKKLGINTVYFAGFDGFGENSNDNYYDNNLVTITKKDDLVLLTKETKEMLLDLKNDIDIKFITKSKYSEFFSERYKDMYKAILFDLDGTLLDTTNGVVEAVKITLSELGLEIPPYEILKQFVGPVMQDSFEKHFGFEKEKALECANLFRVNYKKHSLFLAEPYSGILEFLAFLKGRGCKLAVATNKSHENAMLILEKFGIAKYLDCAVGSDLEGRLSKADMILKCLKELAAEKDEAVLIGDSTADSDGAQKAGVDFIAVTYGFGFKSKDDLKNIPNVGVFENVAEMKDWFEKESYENTLQIDGGG